MEVLKLEAFYPGREIHLIASLQNAINDRAEAELSGLASKIRKVVNLNDVITNLQAGLKSKAERLLKRCEKVQRFSHHVLALFLFSVFMPVWLQKFWLHLVDEESTKSLKLLLFPFFRGDDAVEDVAKVLFKVKHGWLRL